MKQVIYYKKDSLKLTPDGAFMLKMQKLAKAYAEWHKQDVTVMDRIDSIGWNAVYDADGFKDLDKATDKLAKAYNAAHKTDYTGENILCEGDALQNAYFTALDHGLVTTLPATIQ